MTRHYYHENEEALRAAVEAIPSLDALLAGTRGDGGSRLTVQRPTAVATAQTLTPEQRLRQLEKLRKKGLVTDAEYQNTRQRILSEL